MKTLTILAMLLFPVAVLGHVQLDHAEPKVGSTVKVSPAEVKIWFDGPVEVARSRIEVIDADGQTVVAGALRGQDKENTVLIVPIKSAHGKLTVKWQAYCPDCEHTTHGTFTFTVAP
jgi:hypothetical protein